jgi:hypothetical protein
MEIGNFESPWRNQELLARREGCLLRLGKVLPAGTRVALRMAWLLVQALLVSAAALTPLNFRGRRFAGGLVRFGRIGRGFRACHRPQFP